MRLDRILANCGLGSRKQVKALIRSGAVRLSGNTITNPDTQINESDFPQLYIHNNPLNPRLNICLILHKPSGYLTAMEDSRMPCVAELLPAGLPKDIFPVGRLDLDTSGLLLFTTDGQLGHRLCSPEWKIEKRYLFTYDGPPFSEDEIQRVKLGLKLKDFTCLPADLQNLDTGEALLTIREGKFHQVKRMIAALDRCLTALQRESFGALDLGNLAPGATRELNQSEYEQLYHAVRLNPPVV